MVNASGATSCKMVAMKKPVLAHTDKIGKSIKPAWGAKMVKLVDSHNQSKYVRIYESISESANGPIAVATN